MKFIAERSDESFLKMIVGGRLHNQLKHGIGVICQRNCWIVLDRNRQKIMCVSRCNLFINVETLGSAAKREAQLDSCWLRHLACAAKREAQLDSIDVVWEPSEAAIE